MSVASEVTALATRIATEVKAVRREFLKLYPSSSTPASSPRVYTTTVVTDATGAATVTIPSGVFTNAPRVSLTPLSTDATQAVIAELSAAPTATSIGVRTRRTKTTAISGLSGGTAQPVEVSAATVHVIAIGT